MSGTNGNQDKISRRRRFLRAFEAKALANRNISEKISDYITDTVGSMPFLLSNCVIFFFWIIFNINVIPGFVPFDPFPFGFLTMAVSLEAIILSVFILLSENRASRVDSLREELHLQVNLIAEEEITKVLEVLAEIRTKIGIRREDPELTRMLERIDTSYIERALEKQITNSNGNILKILPNANNNGNGNGQKPQQTPEKVEKQEKPH